MFYNLYFSVCIKKLCTFFLISQSEKSSLLSLIFSLFILSLAAHDFSDWFCNFAQQSFESILLAFARFAFDVLSVASLNLRRCLKTAFTQLSKCPAKPLTLIPRYSLNSRSLFIPLERSNTRLCTAGSLR